MSEKTKIFVQLRNRFRDGGTTVYEDKMGLSYFKDHRINSQTKGAIFDRYPSDDGAKCLDVELVVLPEKLELK